MQNFEQIISERLLLKNIASCGYEIPTPIQAAAIPEILAGKDLLASAQTGTGKTAAFVLPILENILLQEFPKPTKAAQPSVLILTPTRELANQINDAIGKYGQNIRLNTVSIIGGESYIKQTKKLSRPVDIIVATPGRLMDYIDRRKVDLSQVKMLVLDEADRMLDMGFIDDVNSIIELTPEDRQTLLFTATVNRNLNELSQDVLDNPFKIELNTKEKTEKKNIEQKFYFIHSKKKFETLQEILENESVYKAIIFTATRTSADELADYLQDLGYNAEAIHGEINQNKRNRVIGRMKENKLQFLVATDVVSRGIDIKDLSHVINFDFPKFSEDYVHRIGRTGRAGSTGVAITLITSNETRYIKKLEKYLGHPVTVYKDGKVYSIAQSERGFGEKGRFERSHHGGERSFGRRSSGGNNFRGEYERAYRSSAPKKRGQELRSSEGRQDRSEYFGRPARFEKTFEGAASQSPQTRFAKNQDKPKRFADKPFSGDKKPRAKTMDRKMPEGGFSPPKLRVRKKKLDS